MDHNTEEENRDNDRILLRRMSCSSCQYNFGRIGCCLIKLRCCGYSTVTPASSATNPASPATATAAPPATTTSCIPDGRGGCAQPATNPAG
ncbi:hypothetical protein CHUAL_013965 [Chamberlinius hualienensis]